MYLPVDEAGWRTRGLQFVAYPTPDNPTGYRFLIPPAAGNPPAADANVAKDKAGNFILTEDGQTRQLDLHPDRYSPHRALQALLSV